MSRRILVVDDYAPAANAIAQLMRLSGHVVTIALAAKDVISLAIASQAEIMLLDLCLEGDLDGVSLARELREYPCLHGATLVAYSGLDLRAHRSRLRDAGFDYHLMKPVSLPALEAIIARAPVVPWTVPKGNSMVG